MNHEGSASLYARPVPWLASFTTYAVLQAKCNNLWDIRITMDWLKHKISLNFYTGRAGLHYILTRLVWNPCGMECSCFLRLTRLPLNLVLLHLHFLLCLSLGIFDVSCVSHLLSASSVFASKTSKKE